MLQKGRMLNLEDVRIIRVNEWCMFLCYANSWSSIYILFASCFPWHSRQQLHNTQLCSFCCVLSSLCAIKYFMEIVLTTLAVKFLLKDHSSPSSHTVGINGVLYLHTQKHIHTAIGKLTTDKSLSMSKETYKYNYSAITTCNKESLAVQCDVCTPCQLFHSLT